MRLPIMRTRYALVTFCKVVLGVLLVFTVLIATILGLWIRGGASRCLMRDALILRRPWSERDSAFVRLPLPRAYDVMICNVYMPGYDHATLEELFARSGRAGALEIRRRLPGENEERAILSALEALTAIHYSGRYNVQTDSLTMRAARSATTRTSDLWLKEPATERIRMIEERP